MADARLGRTGVCSMKVTPTATLVMQRASRYGTIQGHVVGRSTNPFGGVVMTTRPVAEQIARASALSPRHFAKRISRQSPQRT